jgi:acetyltransferase-like isoleucine patch superfamily enzyme
MVTQKLSDKHGIIQVKRKLKLLSKLKLKILHPVFYKKYLKSIDLQELFKDVIFSEESAIQSLYGGGEISIGDGSFLNGQLIIERPNAKIIIGNKVFIGSGSVINSRKLISIGSHVLIASEVLIQDHNSHSLNFEDRRDDIDYTIARYRGNPISGKKFENTKEDEIVIGDDVWIGLRSIILKGVKIGERSIVAAGSVVTRNVPPDTIVAGNPAMIKKISS